MITAEVFVRLSAPRPDGTTVTVECPLDPSHAFNDVLAEAHATEDGPRHPRVCGTLLFSEAKRYRAAAQELKSK